MASGWSSNSSAAFWWRGGTFAINGAAFTFPPRWYPGTWADSDGDTIPDLFLDWERSVPIESVWSTKTGLVHAPYRNWRTGDHRPHGLLLAAGPGIAPGSELGETAIEDLPASLMTRFGEDCTGMDGRPRNWLARANQVEAIGPLNLAPSQ